MKKVLAIMLTVCMVMAFVPAISFAADTTITSNTTAFFTSSGSLSTVEGSSESGSSCVLVAWNHSDNWNAASTFTDTDGTVTNQTVTSGTGFGSSRQAVVSFNIPSDFDSDNVAKVTLGLTVRYVKQINQAGARLAIYGNSVDGTWSTSSNKSIFGVSGTNSGTSSLPLLGLTSPISKAGNNQVDETVTLSSMKLTEYVKQMAEEGKTQVTFRIAVPYGGVWIYNSTSNHPATLTIEEGSLTSVNVNTVYMDGEAEVGSATETVTNLVTGSTYTHSTPEYSVNYNGETYVYDADASTLSVTATADGKATVNIVYTKYDESMTFDGYEIDDEGAWCWFADPRSISYANEEGTLDFSIIGYIDIHGAIKATQINHLTDEVNEVLIRTNIQPDDHNNPTFLVLPDERIIVFYSRHTDEACFWYRVTEEPGDLTTLGEEKCLNTSANTTYPSPFLMENDPDHIYLMWRGIDWHPTIAKLSLPDENGEVEFTYGPYQMVKSTAARPYAKYSSNGVDKLYVTYTLGHPDNEANNWVFFNQIDIDTMTLEDINGNTMTTIADGYLNVNASNYSQSHIVDAVSMRDWVWQVAEGDDGYPVIAMVRINGGKTSHDYYYVKWNGEEWVKTFLANGGGHFHQTAGLEMCYSGGMAIDPDNTNIMYCSVPTLGAFGTVYEIIKYTMSDDGTEVISTEQITKNSEKNNVRPYVIGNSEGKDIRLTWMHGDYYDWIVSNERPLGYCTAVHAEASLPTKTVDLEDAVVSEDYSSIGGAFVSTTETANVVEIIENGNFAVSADIYLDGDYEGKLLDMGEIELSVETKSTQYGANATGDRARVVLTVNGTDYVTSNVYGSSDCWQSYGRGTGGNYGVENYDNYINHTLTYDGEYLTLYRDGLVDIKIKAEGLVLENVAVGGFDGLADNVAVYDRVLNHDEIKALVANKGEVEEPDAEGDVTVTKRYVDINGTEIKATETVTLAPGSDYYNFVPEETVDVGNATYSASHWDCEGNVYTCYYYKSAELGENIMTNGSFEDENGNFSLEGWNSAQTLAQFGSPYSTNHCYAVNSTTAISSNAQTSLATTIPDGEWAFGSRWNDGAAGLCSLMRYVPVESGKTYQISFKLKHKNASADAGYLKISLVDQEYSSNDANAIEKNTTNPGIVGNEWTTYTREFTATDATDHVLFWFRWLGEGNNSGNGPYWYFDDFQIREIKEVEVAQVTFDGVVMTTNGTLTLGEDGALPENVIGYHVTQGDETKLVGAGELAVSDGDVITTANINVSMVTGAQVRYGGGVDENGKVSSGNGLRFIAQVDRSSVGEEVTGYGIEISAEGSSAVVDIPATKWQDGEAQTIFTAAITDIAVSNYNRNFTARPYVMVEYSDGTTAKIYSTETITRSIYQVAAGLLKNTDSDTVDGKDADYSASDYGLYDVLNAYVNMVGIRLDMDENGNFTARTEGKGAYTGDIFFDVTSKEVSDGVYEVTVTPVDTFANKVTIMSYWDEFIRINNNNSAVVNGITNYNVDENGVLTFTFTPANAKAE